MPKFLLKNLSPSHPYKIPYPSYFELLNLLHRYFPSKHLPSSLEPSPTLPEFLLPYVNHRVLKGIEEIIENLSDCLFNFSKRDDDCQEFVNETSLSHLNTPIYEFLEKKLGTNCEIVMTCALMEEENIYLVKELIKGYYNRENIFKIEGIFNDVKIIDKWSKVAFFKNLKYANAVRLFEKKEMESIWRNIQTIKNKQTEKISSQNEVKEALYLIKTEFLIAELLSINLTEKKLMDLVSNLIKERSQLPKILNEFECYSIFSEHNFLPFYNSKELLKIFQTQYEKLNNREKIKLMAMFGNKQNELDLIFLQDFDSVIETADFKEVCQLARIFSNDQGLTDFLISQELNEENINDLTKYKFNFFYELINYINL